MENRGQTLRRSLVAAGLVSAVVALGGGCTNMLFTAAYLIKGHDSPAECTKLREKRVAVVCRPVVALQYRDARVDQDLATELGGLLQKNVTKIKVIDHRKVAEWMDEHNWDDYTEVGKALGAELVVGVDLLSFNLRQSQTLLQGQADTEIRVVDCATREVVFKKRLPKVVYPPHREVQASDMQEQQFRRDFVHVLAERIGEHFYPHDAYSDFAMDSKHVE
jgi:hypothetical protein